MISTETELRLLEFKGADIGRSGNEFEARIMARVLLFRVEPFPMANRIVNITLTSPVEPLNHVYGKGWIIQISEAIVAEQPVMSYGNNASEK